MPGAGEDGFWFSVSGFWFLVFGVIAVHKNNFALVERVSRPASGEIVHNWKEVSRTTIILRVLNELNRTFVSAPDGGEGLAKRKGVIVSQFLEKKLRLKINQGKSAVARPGERKFLGFSFTFGEAPKRRIAPQSLKRFRLKVKELPRIGRSSNLSLLVERLRLHLTGWRSYFGFCESPSVLSKLDKWIRRRLRMVQWQQWNGSEAGPGLRNYANALATMNWPPKRRAMHMVPGG